MNLLADENFPRPVIEPIAILYFRCHPIIADEVFAACKRALAETPDGYFAVVTPENTRLRPLRPPTIKS